MKQRFSFIFKKIIITTILNSQMGEIAKLINNISYDWMNDISPEFGQPGLAA